MQLTYLSWLASQPSTVLRWPNACVMLDCPLDWQSVLHFEPLVAARSGRHSSSSQYRPDLGVQQLRETGNGEGVMIADQPQWHPTPSHAMQMESVDVIVVSNWHSLLALPFYIGDEDAVEGASAGTGGFRGLIYATEPVLHFGRLLMEELLEYVARIPETGRGEAEAEKKWKEATSSLPIPPRRVAEWRRLYTREAMERVLKRVHTIAFRQTVVTPGGVSVTACPNSYAIGASSWLIATEYEKVAYISPCGSRATHAMASEFDKLRGADCLLLTGLNRTPELAMEQQVLGCVNCVVDTVKRGGNAILPVLPAGTMYDMIEVLVRAMDQTNVSLDVLIYVVSPVAERSFAYADVSAEWLSETRQASVYVPEEPFQHRNLRASGRLRVYPAVSGAFSRECRQPCVVLCGHPCLRLGDAAQLIDAWGGDSKNAVICTDPDFPLSDVWEPFAHLPIRAHSFPIDPRLDFNRVNTTIMPDLKPKVLFVPEQYTRPPLNGRMDSVVQYNPHTALRYEETINVASKLKRKRCQFHPEVMRRLVLKGCAGNADFGFATVKGTLCAYDNAFQVQNKKLRSSTAAVRPRYTGRLTVDAVQKALTKKNLVSRVTKGAAAGEHVVRVDSLSASITLKQDGARSNIQAPRAHRALLAEVVGSVLASL